MRNTTLPFPVKVLDQHTIFLGKTRSGKSSKVRLAVEYLLDHEEPVCIITPKDDWWGLKSSADGKTAGYPVICFGGKHADIQINGHSGAQVAELVATGNRPCIISLEGMRLTERNRFFIDFSEAFFLHTRGTRWLVIDECHNFVPKGKIFSPDVGEMLHWGNRLASEGQGKGIILLSASQRPQKVHNDYLTSHETLIACRVIHKADRDAIKDWVDGCGDPVVGKEMIGGLAAMQRPEAWVWSPEIGFGPKQIIFPMFRTYDSFKPQTGATAKLKGWAAVNLDEVRGKLAKVVEEMEANDPAKLKAEIARLTRELAKAPKTATINGKAVAALDRVMLDDAFKKGGDAVRETIPSLLDAQHQASFESGFKAASGAIRFETIPAPPRKALAGAQKVIQTPQRAPVPPPQRSPRPDAQPLTFGKVVIEAGSMGAERKPLGALASVYPAGMTEAQWAVAAGIKRSGGTWAAYKSRLRSAGRVEERGDLWFATDQGMADLGGAIPVMPPPGPQLVEFWAGKISGAGPMLRALAEIYPLMTSRENLAVKLNMAASGGTFAAYISRLRSPGLIEVSKDGLRASDALMAD